MMEDSIPYFFGEPVPELFGCFHPSTATGNGLAALLLAPVGHEYMASHRAMRQLGLTLGRAGIPALRFDYFGCGDSHGDGTEGRLARWLEDSGQALDELIRRTGTAKIAVIGHRLGASLAALLVHGRDPVDALVLWDPVVNGRAHLETLARLQETVLELPPPTGPDGPREILGFPLPAELRADIEALDLLALPTCPAARVLVVESTDADGEYRALLERLRLLGAAASHERHSVPAPDLTRVDRVSVPGAVIRRVAEWLSEPRP